MSPHLKLAADALKVAEVVANTPLEDSDLEQINVGVLAAREVIRAIESGATTYHSILVLHALANRYGEKVSTGICKGLHDHIAHSSPKEVA